MFFLKKKNIPALHNVLDEEKKRAKNNIFYYPLFDNDINSAERWCDKNGYFMNIDHLRDGNIFYKFAPKI